MTVRKVEVKVTTQDGKDNTAVPVYVGADRGAGEVKLSGQDLVCNKDTASFELRPGQFLVIEGFPATQAAYDRDQAAAYHTNSQKSDEGIDKPTVAKKEEFSFNKPQTGGSGNAPSSAQSQKPTQVEQKTGGSGTSDSRLASSPGTTTTPEMAKTPSANTGAPASKPGEAAKK